MQPFEPWTPDTSDAAALKRVRELHERQEKPVKSWDQLCPEHAYDPATRSFGRYADVTACPDCRYTEHYVCSHCECPNDEWPCPTIRALDEPAVTSPAR